MYSRAAIICTLLLGGVTHAAPLLPLRVVESSKTEEGHPLSELVDGDVNPGNGLDMAGGQDSEQTIIFATEAPVTAQVFQFTTWHVSEEKGAYPAALEFSVTSDDRPARDGNWKPLKASLVITDTFPASPHLVRAVDDFIHMGPGLEHVLLTVRAPNTLTGVTGFRLRFLTAETGQGDAKAIGRSDRGNCVINEFQVQPDPLRSSNVALGRPVRASGPVWLPEYYLTDGVPASFSHPGRDFPALNFHYEIDLGTSRTMDYIVLRSRVDDVEPYRLGNYELQLYDDDGTGHPGELRWSARMRQDGSHVPSGGRDLISAEDGAGESFSGRFLRIVNLVEALYRPQVGELEVYPMLYPQVAMVSVDGRSIDPSEELPPGSGQLEFALMAGPHDPSPDLLDFRWRRTDVANAPWVECRSGERMTIACPHAGIYPIEFQARHTDGRWSRQVQRHSFIVPAPWWRSPLRLGMLALSSLIAIAGIAWWASVRRLRRKLELAQAARAMEQDRLRIARDMHDDIGARLTHMALLADRLKRAPDPAPDLLVKLAGEARNTVGALDQIVWAVNPRHDTVGSLADYLCDHANDFLADAGLHCHFDMPAEGRDALLPFAIRHPLLMAVKEALQNVVKHAGASRVALSMATTAREIRLTVSDDGKGIAAGDGQPASGDGLGNMAGRLAEIGGSCEIGRSSSGGTLVTLTVPWNHAS
ncbi:histidine kinase [Luteolibacter flavescens]|uniref:histidine kinase n=1 Tax=Luteolibacter flavescens TaxID=1859460 RepID=A0ABT3FVN6_9BACT|nr:ATP-binding protein [Luteolibacter flavescens]MCW1887653.1 histidine kinase [Luteolibacter flavescens]